ncbi:MAG: hypothetical protein ACK5LP_05110 [Campylobacteraceae bacterium]
MSTKVKKGLKHIVMMLLMGFLSMFVYLFIVLFLAGCTTKIEYIDRVKTVETKVPTKCTLEIPTLEKYITINDDDTEDIKQQKRLQNKANGFTYTEELENTLKACRGDK